MRLLGVAFDNIMQGCQPGLSSNSSPSSCCSAVSIDLVALSAITAPLPTSSCCPHSHYTFLRLTPCPEVWEERERLLGAFSRATVVSLSWCGNTCLTTSLQAPRSKNRDSFINFGLTECMRNLRKFKWGWKLFKYAFPLLICTFNSTSGLENFKPQISS